MGLSLVDKEWIEFLCRFRTVLILDACTATRLPDIPVIRGRNNGKFRNFFVEKYCKKPEPLKK